MLLRKVELLEVVVRLETHHAPPARNHALFVNFTEVLNQGGRLGEAEFGVLFEFCSSLQDLLAKAIWLDISG